MGEARSAQLGTPPQAGSPVPAPGTMGWPGPSHFHPRAILSPVRPGQALVEVAPQCWGLLSSTAHQPAAPFQPGPPRQWFSLTAPFPSLSLCQSPGMSWDPASLPKGAFCGTLQI